MCQVSNWIYGSGVQKRDLGYRLKCVIYLFIGNNSSHMHGYDRLRNEKRIKENQAKSLSQILTLSDQVDDSIMGNVIEKVMRRKNKTKFYHVSPGMILFQTGKYDHLCALIEIKKF